MPDKVYDDTGGCRGKHSYASAGGARRALKQIQKRWRSDKGRSFMNIYRCSECNGYHLGRNRQGKMK
jgi:hypothetical protein